MISESTRPVRRLDGPSGSPLEVAAGTAAQAGVPTSRLARRQPTPLAVPTRLIQQLMRTLANARLVTEAAGADPAYLPARPLETITCHDILIALRASQGNELATRDEPSRAEVYGEFHRIAEAGRQAAASVTMLTLVDRTRGEKRLAE